MATPLMEQYSRVKEQNKDCILLYRMGDFYELFDDDAVVASKILGLTLTSRNNGSAEKTPLAGFPYHSIEKHMPKLVNAGYKVAICEQTEDPAQAKGIVKREVIEVITKGTTINENCLDSKSNNYIASLVNTEAECGLAYLDITTGMFVVTEGSESQVADEIYRLDIKELLYNEDIPLPDNIQEICTQSKILTTPLDKFQFNMKESLQHLTNHFKVHSLETFGCESLSSSIQAAGAVLKYVMLHKKTDLHHITGLKYRTFDGQMNLDSATIRNLELLKPLHADDDDGTLFSLLDSTVTAMGGRKLKFWMTHPLLDAPKINMRQDAIQELIENQTLLKSIRSDLREINDIERILARVGSKRANARDLLGLGRSLIHASKVSQHMGELVSPLFSDIQALLNPLRGEGEALTENFSESPPLTIREGKMLNYQKHTELQEIIDEAEKGKEWLNKLETTVKEETGISALKVGFNKVFGYYIEVSKQNVSKVPENFIRKQTLVNGERFITPEMKEWEVKILNAEEKAHKLEYEIFCKIREAAGAHTARYLKASNALAAIDVITCLAKAALKYNYCRPEFVEEDTINIVGGRHPVVEKLTEVGNYIPNDALLNTKDRQILLITGPNMAGKSTYLRQVALVTLMAQMGSFVPADTVQLSLVDRIFTRVGASDRLARGQSTFMVEMIETASILNNATSRSLILLDEIGRGTSTFDGLSLAWAIVEAIHNTQNIAAKTLFATHYHELTELPERLDRTVNIHISVKEVGNKVIFLRKIVEGPCDSSYGIQVAGMAGIPTSVLDRAWEILADLEKSKPHSHEISTASKPKKKLTPENQQSLFNIPVNPENPQHKKLFEEVKALDPNNMTPMDALNALSKLKEKYKES